MELKYFLLFKIEIIAKTRIIFLKKNIFLGKDKEKFSENNKFNNRLIHII